MFSTEILTAWLRDAVNNPAEYQWLIPWLPGIAKLLNAYGSELSVEEHDLDIQSMLQNVVWQLGKKTPIGADELKLEIVKCLKNTVQPPSGVTSFSLESPSNPHSEAQLKQSTIVHQIAKPRERESISRLRTTTTKNNGRKLAEAALSLRHQIKWLPRGEEGFLPVSTKTHSHSGRGVNHFSQWLSAHAVDLEDMVGNVLQPRMNCWESVFYTAYKADLVSKGVLRAMFSEAVRLGQVNFGEENRIALARNESPPNKNKSRDAVGHYVEELYRCLKGREAIKIIRDEDTPKKGDLVFVGGMSHVCICVGKQQETASKKFVPHVMSLWHHDYERYTLLPFTELFESRDSIWIRPCPF